MSSYEDYIEALTVLCAAITQADHADAQANRENGATSSAAEQDQKEKIADLQQHAQDSARDYATSVAKVRRAEGIGIEPPVRVRPATNNEPLSAAIARQRAATNALMRALADYDAARQATLAPPSPSPSNEPAAPHWFARLMAWFKRLVNKPAGTTPRKGSTGLQTLTQATEHGTMSGYEPGALKGVKIPDLPLLYGIPGAGLSESGFSEAAVKLGQKGERNFALALVKANLISHFATFWSIHMLAQDTYGKEQSDVDCAIVTGNTIWLIDLKYYSSGNVIYRQSGENELICWDVPTGRQIGPTRKMTRNMKMALERFGKRYSSYSSLRIEARVVFVPTASGVGQIENVRWPGDIPAVTLPEFLAELAGEPPFRETVESDLVRRTFQALVKN